MSNDQVVTSGTSTFLLVNGEAVISGVKFIGEPKSNASISLQTHIMNERAEEKIER